jgi:hypothetical protein
VETLPLSSAPETFLAKLAPMSAGGWHALGAQIFPGELSVATENTVYRFKGGVFQGRARKNARTFECPKAMRALRLIGFLSDEGGGLWSLSPRWREGSHGVLWQPGETDEQSFLLTSPTREFTLEEQAPRAARSVNIKIRRPLPASTTRIHNALPFVAGSY